jgi:hypothetical protein
MATLQLDWFQVDTSCAAIYALGKLKETRSNVLGKCINGVFFNS